MKYPPIETLVPHRHPMLLLDRIIDVDFTSGAITCTASIGEDHPFLENGEVDILVCVELVAQSVAAYAGYADVLAGRRPKVGFLVSCREATFDAPALLVGDELEIMARHRWGENLLGSFNGHVNRGGLRIATVEIGVFSGSPAPTRGPS